MFDQLKDDLGQWWNGTQLNIDLVNGCCLACPSCAIGSIGTKRKGIMTFDTFRKILDKAQRETKIRRVQLYMYSDPCMHKDLHLFVQECTDRGIKSWISTMLQVTNCDFEKVIEARPTEFRVSFPGWDEMGYYQSKAADPARFDRKFEEVIKLPRHKETVWNLVWHYYRTNGHEENRVMALAAYAGMNFVRLPAIFMPLETYVEGTYTEKDRELIGRLWESPEVAASRMKKTDTCFLWKQLAIDANGDVFLCQLLYQERFKLVNFLDYPYKAIKKMIQTHEFCGKCLSKGGNVLQACYAPLDEYKGEAIAEANKKRRL